MSSTSTKYNSADCGISNYRIEHNRKVLSSFYYFYFITNDINVVLLKCIFNP